MIFHGEWTRYVPAPLPVGWPEWASYWKRVSDGVDWYQWTRENWSVENGTDTTGTVKVLVVSGVAISKATDVTGLGGPDGYDLYELEAGDVVPELLWILVGGQFRPPD